MIRLLVCSIVLLLMGSPAFAAVGVRTLNSSTVVETLVHFGSGDAINAISDPIKSCLSMTVFWEQSTATNVSLYEVSSTDTTFTLVEASTLVNAFTTTAKYGPFNPSKSYLRFVVDAATTGSVVSTARVQCSNMASVLSAPAQLIGFPDVAAAIGGVGRPTQALIVDTLLMHQRLSGPGKSASGAIYTSSCVADAVDDFPCSGSVGLGSVVELDTTGGGIADTTLSIDPAANDGITYWCRDGTTFVHSKDTAGDVEITTAEGDMVPAVLWDADLDIYRMLALDTSIANCAATGASDTFDSHGEFTFTPNAADNVQQAIEDGVHFSPYGARWFAQTLLLAKWEDQYPAILGVDNLSGGYFDTGCGALTASSGTSGILPFDPTSQAGGDGFVIAGCRYVPVAGATFTGNLVTIDPGYYVGQIMLNLNGTTNNDRSFTVRIQNQAGTNLTDTAFWVSGITNGTDGELVDDVDPTGLGTPGEYNLRERTCYGGCTIRFAFLATPADTRFRIQLNNSQVYNVTVDEMWVRKKIFPDLKRHFIIADGKAEIQLFTDSRGNPNAFERLPRALDYMTGYLTDNGQRTSIRPDLYLTKPISKNTFWVSGERLGDFVGPNDGDLDYSGNPITTDFQNVISPTANYCVAFFGINDQLGGNARPGTAANAATPDVGNEHLYFGDQLRGFEQVAEEKGCIPLILMDHIGRGDTSLTSCHEDDGSAVNCGTWNSEHWGEILHNGIH